MRECTNKWGFKVSKLMEIKHRMMDISKKLVFTFLKCMKMYGFLRICISEFAKFADFYFDIKFVGIQTECYTVRLS
jgi:hypothetical protein